MGDLGAVGAKAYGGKPHIILKGNPSLRKVVTGTKYGMQNPKVMTMGLGKAGAIHAAKAGGILSVVLLSAYRVVDYFLTDHSTLNQLVGSLATGLDELGHDTRAYLQSRKREALANASKTTESAIDYVIDSVRVTMVRMAQRYARRYLSTKPKTY